MSGNKSPISFKFESKWLVTSECGDIIKNEWRFMENGERIGSMKKKM